MNMQDRSGAYGGLSPASYLKPLAPGSKICGPAVTIRNIPVRKTATQGSHDHDCIAMSTRDIYYIGEPGDLMLADDSGVCICPPLIAADVLAECQKIAAAEERMRELIESKAPISELRPLFRSRYK